MPKYYPNTTTTNYPFGMLIKERAYTSDSYRFGFNGKENDNEIFSGCIAFEARIFDSRLGRFFSTDPWESKYYWQTPYAYFKNSPISLVDFLGKGAVIPEDEEMDIRNIDDQNDDNIENRKISEAQNESLLGDLNKLRNSNSTNPTKDIIDNKGIQESFEDDLRVKVLDHLQNRVKSGEPLNREDVNMYLNTELSADKGIYNGKAALISGVATKNVDDDELALWKSGGIPPTLGDHKVVISTNPAIPTTGATYGHTEIQFITFVEPIYEYQGTGTNRRLVKVQEGQHLMFNFRITLVDNM